jgi:hypothetical protein
VIDQEPADAPSPIDFRSPPAGHDGSPSGQRLEERRKACSSVPVVVVILPVGGRPGASRSATAPAGAAGGTSRPCKRPASSGRRVAGKPPTHLPSSRQSGCFVPAESPIGGCDAAGARFFSVCRTVSWLMESTTSSATRWSAKRRRLHWLRPSGVSEQARRMSSASCSPSSFRSYSRSGAFRWTVPRVCRARRSGGGSRRRRPQTAPRPRRCGRRSRPDPQGHRRLSAGREPGPARGRRLRPDR